MALPGHGFRHLRGGADEIPGIVVLGPATGEPSTDPTTPSEGDLLVGDGDTGVFVILNISVPAANVRNVLGVDNGETSPSWKTALDSTNPAAITTSASPGTSLVFAHRDHVHSGLHTLLDAALHSDTAAQSVTAGSLIYGNSTPKWDELAKGTDDQVLTMVAGLPAWAAAAAGGGGGPIYIPFGTDRLGQSYTP